jgi:hypothetical protein
MLGTIPPAMQVKKMATRRRSAHPLPPVSFERLLPHRQQLPYGPGFRAPHAHRHVPSPCWVPSRRISEGASGQSVRKPERRSTALVSVTACLLDLPIHSVQKAFPATTKDGSFLISLSLRTARAIKSDDPRAGGRVDRSDFGISTASSASPSFTSFMTARLPAEVTSP